MIFKTIDADATNLTKKMGLLGKSFNDIKKDYSNGLGITKSLFSTSISESDWKSLQKFNSAIKVTNDGLTKSQRITKAWNENMTGCSIAAKRMGNDLVTGKKKISDVSSAMKTATASTKALEIAMNVFANVGFMLAITAVTKVISELAQAQSNAVETAKEATSAYNDELSSIKDYKEKISELNEELNSGNLSYEETKTKRSELMSIQDELIEKFGTEKSAIESVTEAIGGQVDALDDLNEKSYRDWIAKADDETIWTKLLPWGKSGLDQAIDYMETKQTVSFNDMQNANLSDELQEIQKEIDETIQSKYNLDKTFAMFNVTGTPDDIKKQLDNILQDYMDVSKEIFEREKIPSNLWEEYRKETVESINDIKNQFDEGLEKHQETYKTYIEGMIKYDSEYSDEYATILRKRAELEDAENSGDTEKIQKARQEFMDAITSGITASESDENIKKYFESLYPELQAEFANWNFEIAINANTDNLKDEAEEIGKQYSATDLLDMVNTEGVQEGEEAFNKLIDKAIEYGVCTDNSSEEVQKLIDLLVELGIVQGNINSDVQHETQTSFEIPDAETLKQQISDLNSAIDSIQSAYDTLNSAVEEYNSNGGQLSIDTIQSLLSLSDEYLACLQVENGQLSLNADAMAQLAQAKLDEAQATAVTQAMTELQAIANGEAAQSTTNYITGNAALMSSLAQLSGSYEGVAQAAMTAAQAQELSAQISAAASKDKTATENVMKGLDNKLKLIQATKTTISAGNFAKVAKKSSSSKSGSSSKNYETELKKQLESIKTEYEKGSITLDEYYEKSLSLIKQYYDEGKIEASDFYDNNKSLLDDYLKYLEIAYKRGSMPYGEYFAKYLKAVQDCYDKGAISTEEYWNYNKELLDDYVDSAKKILDNLYDHKSMQAAGVSDLKQYLTTCYEMIKSFYNQGKISAYDYYSYLSDFYDYQISVYDKVIDAVTNKLDDQIDALEKQKDQIEKNYNAQIDVLEKEKDALEAENDARKDAIDLQKVLYEMNRTQNQRTDLVYKDGQMVYVADQQGIRDKKDELDDLEYQRKIKEIEKQISSLEKTMDSLTDCIDQQIEDLNNYKDQWEDVKNKFVEQQNELLAEQIIGKNWEIDIQNMRMEALVEFTNKYIAMQQAQADAAVAAANKIVEAQRSIAAMQNTTPTTISTPSTSNSSSGGSGGSNKNTTFKSNNIKAEVRSVVSPGYKTSGEASSKISSYNGNGVMKKNGKWYVYKKYASGTDNAEKGWHIVSEDNIGDEIVIDNNGNAVIPHGEQLYNFQGGEQVIPANESKEIIENQGNVEKIPDKVVLGDGTVLTPVSHVMEISDSIRQSMMKNVAFPDNIGQRNYENLMKNANNISNVNNNQPTDNSVSIGEIHLHEVQNVDEFSKAIIHKFPGKMRQALYSR